MRDLSHGCVNETRARPRGHRPRPQQPTRFRLAILDMVMPELGGAAVFGQLRELARDLKVLPASGYSMKRRA